MKYEVVSLKEKIIVGISAVTGNGDPKMGEIVGGLWQKLYGDGIIATIKNKASRHTIGLYSDYESDKYRVTAGSEVSSAQNDGLTTRTIPAGKYAKFSVHGHMVKAVAQAWGEIWQMDLDRSFTGDFEEYKNSDVDNCDIDIYIALKSEGVAHYKREFVRMMGSQNEIALATSTQGMPNVRIVDFYYDEAQKKLYFASFADNVKCLEIKSNPNVAFTTISPIGNEHVRVKRATAIKSEVTALMIKDKFLAKMPEHIMGMPHLLPELCLFEVTFYDADVVIDFEHMDSISL